MPSYMVMLRYLWHFSPHPRTRAAHETANLFARRRRIGLYEHQPRGLHRV